MQGKEGRRWRGSLTKPRPRALNLVNERASYPQRKKRANKFEGVGGFCAPYVKKEGAIAPSEATRGDYCALSIEARTENSEVRAAAASR